MSGAAAIPAAWKEWLLQNRNRGCDPEGLIQKACEYEIKRQIKAYETGEPIVQETRLWDEGKQLSLIHI